MPRLVTFVLFLASIGCPSGSGPTTTRSHATATISELLIDESPGFVEWVSADAQFLVVRVFDTDSNGDGHIGGEVGEHGEPQGDTPRVVLRNRTTVVDDTIAEFVSGDAEGRFFVYVDAAGVLQLFSSQAGRSTPLSDADASADNANPCLPHRAAAFDASGRWLGWMTHGGYRVRDLATGRERTWEVPNRSLWRAQPTPFGWAVVQTVAKGAPFPKEKTSCASSWAWRYARSIGKYGVDGDWEMLLVGPRTLPLDKRWVPLGDDVLLDPDNGLLAAGSGPLALPTGCAFYAFAPGAPSVLLQCASKPVLFFPETTAVIALDGAVLAPGLQRVSANDRIPRTVVRTRTATGEAFSTLNWETGQLSEIAAIDRMVTADRDWSVGQRGEMAVFVSASGALWQTPGIADSKFVALGGPAFELVDPARGLRHQAPRPAAVFGPCGLYTDLRKPSPMVLRCVVTQSPR